MATLNFATREITAKVVYFGTSGAGCNTNVERLYGMVEARHRSALHKFGPRESDERSWYFDYLPAGESPIGGFQIGYRVYSLPGGMEMAVHREEVLRGADAVVFVADARVDRNQPNIDSLLLLESLLASVGLELEGLPVVLQVNHGDSEEARPASDVVFDLNPYGFPVVAAVARDGRGVVETHQEAVAAVVSRIRDALSGNEASITITAVHVPDRETDADVIRRHVEAIQQRAAQTPEVDEIASEEGDLRAAPPPPLDLPDGPQVEVAFQPRDFVGSHPARVLRAQVEGDRVRVDLAMERMSGGDLRPLTVYLANRPTDTPPMVRHAASPAADDDEDRVFDYLPEAEAVAMHETPPTDLPGIWYGILGVAGGIVIGLLSGYLLGVVL